MTLSFDESLRVTSPTFTGMHSYKGLDFDFYHYDLYQVELSLEEFADILNDDKNKIIIFEWAENLSEEIRKSFVSETFLLRSIGIDVLEDEVRKFQIN